jgi:hypothetical protein
MSSDQRSRAGVAAGLALTLAGLATIVFGSLWIGLAAVALGVVTARAVAGSARSHGVRG